MTNESTQRAIAVKVAESATATEREALLNWMVGLLQIRDSSQTATRKARLALQLTYKSKVIWPVVKAISLEVKRHGWDERSTKAKYGLVGAATGIALFGSQGAGIAALGTAIGVPLWVVLGAGAAFAAPFVERLRELVPREHHPPQAVQDPNVIDIEAKDVRDK